MKMWSLGVCLIAFQIRYSGTKSKGNKHLKVLSLVVQRHHLH